MDTNFHLPTPKENNSLRLSSLFSRAFVAFGSGFIGLIILYGILLSTWGVVGDILSPTNTGTEDLGLSLSEKQTHPLFLVVVLIAVFLSGLGSNISYALLASITCPEFNRRSTTLTHVFFGNVAFLIFFLFIYMAMNASFGTTGIMFSAILHMIVTGFFTFFVIQALHEAKHLVVNIYGNIIGLLMFIFFAGIFAGIFERSMLVLLTIPFYYGFMAFGNRTMELVYGWMYHSYGSDFLNIDTQFGEDYNTKKPNSKEDFSDLDI